MPSLNEEQIREIIRDELRGFDTIERYTFQKHLQIFDGRNVQTGRTVGTKFPAASDQLWGAFGVTPVNQPATVSDPSIASVSGSGADATINTNFTNLDNAVEAIIDRLQELGLIA